MKHPKLKNLGGLTNVAGRSETHNINNKIQSIKNVLVIIRCVIRLAIA